MQKSLLVMPSSGHSGRVEQTDEKLAGETSHVCVLTSGANIAEYGRTNSACVPLGRYQISMEKIGHLISVFKTFGTARFCETTIRQTLMSSFVVRKRYKTWDRKWDIDIKI